MAVQAKKVVVQVNNLKKYFNVKGRKDAKLHAVDGVSFEILQGETLGLVGESGCGKSTVGNVLLQLHQPTGGEMIFEGKDVFKATKAERFELCRQIQLIFQDPYSSLNPRKTVRSILEEAYKIHHIAKGAELDRYIDELCKDTGITKDMMDKYPHELDGGKRQIVGIARALSLSPDFIVCDEPVSSLDVSIQATIINLLMDIQAKRGLSYLFISHDLSVVRHISNRIAIMYLGEIIELAPTDTIFEDAKHPYALSLLSAVPTVKIGKKIQRIVLSGDVPSPVDPAPGCRFAPRCWMAQERCTKESPRLEEISEGHHVACHFHEQSREYAQKIKVSQSVSEPQMPGSPAQDSTRS